MKPLYYLFLFGICLLLNGCNALLDVKPTDSLLTTDAFSDLANNNATLVAVYQDMETVDYYGRDFVLLPDILADNGFLTRVESGRFANYDRNRIGAHIDLYALAYRNINRLNLVIANVDAAAGETAAKNQLKGEALFLRALHYFDLVRTYARPPEKLVNGFDLGVPLELKPTATADQLDYPARATVSNVYTQIGQDLSAAIGLLDNSRTPSRAGKVAAQALASRVYLYRQDWKNAETFATETINAATSAGVTLATTANYAQSWGNNYPEAIFQLTFQAGRGLESESLQAAYYIHPRFNGWGDVSARRFFMGDQGTEPGLYGADDLRRNVYRRTAKSGQNVIFPLKFPGAKTYGADDIMVLRLSELYLNRAEARARQGNAAGALADVNVIHTRALPGKPLANLIGPALLTAIWRERNAELGFEGHRLFDLLRTADLSKSGDGPGSFIKVSDAFYDRQIAGNLTNISLDDYRLISRLPGIELQANPNLKQNPGY